MILTAVMAHRAPETTVNLPTLITREATFLPETVNEQDRTVELTWTTGARVLRGFWERYWEELSLDPKHVRMKRLNNGAPLLSDHRGSIMSVVGVVEEASLDAKRGRAKVRFAKAEDDPEADKIFRKVKDGILQNISVGYSTYKMEKVEDGADKIPVYRATDWEPFELSIVAMGADDGAGFRSQNQGTSPCVFVTPRTAATATRKAATMDPDDDTNPTPAPQESPAVAITRATAQARGEDAKRIAIERETAAQEALAAERVRVSGIRSLAKRTKLGADWADKMIEAGVKLDDARKAAIDHIADEPDEIDSNTGLRISAGDDARDKFVRGASAWLFQRTGTRSMVERAKEKYPEQFKDVSFDAGEFRGCSPIDLARLSLERNRVNVRGMDRMKMVGLAFTQRASNYQMSGDFATLLENVLGKVLLGAYATQANTWEQFCKRDEVPDFRTSNRYRSGSLPGLDVIAEHAEYKNGIIPDGSKYPLSTQRMGKMFGISQETIINDDMGALTQMATELGKAAQRSIENAVYALLALNAGLGPTQSDAQPFFHANRLNVATGAALGATGAVDADRIVMRSQKDPNGQDYLDLNPAVLLVPESLRGTALQINGSEFDTTVSSKFQIPNTVRGLFRQVVSSPRLTGTRRYLFADTMDAIVVAFLEGQPGPVIDSQNGWRIDGTEFKVTLYAKAQMGDPKAAVTNAGI